MFLKAFLILAIISKVHNVLNDFANVVTTKKQKFSSTLTSHECENPDHWNYHTELAITGAALIPVKVVIPIGWFLLIGTAISYLRDTFKYEITYYRYKIRELKDLKIYNDSWYKNPIGHSLVPTNGILKCLNKNPGSDNCQLHDVCLSFYEREKTMSRKYELGGYDHASEIISIYWNYYHCYKHLETYYTCPNPCNKNPCNDIAKATRHCSSFFDRKHQMKLDYRASAFRSILQLNFTCRCEHGHKWNSEKQTCDEKQPGKNCSCNRNQDCEGDTCICKPLWTGTNCDKSINPCLNAEFNGCGQDHKCQRDLNSITGYNCGCEKMGKYRAAQIENGQIIDPRCVDIDECQTHYNDKCLNGGKCKNINGSYVCDCKKDFEGESCEKQKYIYRYKWLDWGPWEDCSSPCFKGHRLRKRKCTISNMCPGKDSQTNSCDNSKRSGCNQYKIIKPPRYEENKTFYVRQILDSESFKIYLLHQSALNSAKRTLIFPLFDFFLIFIIILE